MSDKFKDVISFIVTNPPQIKENRYSIVGVGMTKCPNCGNKVKEFIHNSENFIFPHIDVTYECKCGFWTHFTLRSPKPKREIQIISLKN